MVYLALLLRGFRRISFFSDDMNCASFFFFFNCHGNLPNPHQLPGVLWTVRGQQNASLIFFFPACNRDRLYNILHVSKLLNARVSFSPISCRLWLCTVVRSTSLKIHQLKNVQCTLNSCMCNNTAPFRRACNMTCQHHCNKTSQVSAESNVVVPEFKLLVSRTCLRCFHHTTCLHF